MTEQYCISDNLISSKEEISPSGKFRLTINEYKTEEGSWSYTKGIISRIADGVMIAEICRDYLNFNHSFFIGKNGEEWLWTGKTYLSQCFVNLDTGKIFDNSKTSTDSYGLCWANVKANPSGTILAVEACVWGGPYEITFYDFSNPDQGWPVIEINDNNSDHDLCTDDESQTKWLDDETFEYISMLEFSTRFNKYVVDLNTEEFEQLLEQETTNKLMYRIVVKKIDDKMHFTTIENSDAYIERRRQYKESERKETEFRDNLRSKNSKYLTFWETFATEPKLLLFFTHNSKMYNFDVPIDEAHFGINLIYNKKEYEVRFYPDSVIVHCGEDKITCNGVEDAINYIKNAS